MPGNRKSILCKGHGKGRKRKGNRTTKGKDEIGKKEKEGMGNRKRKGKQTDQGKKVKKMK